MRSIAERATLRPVCTEPVKLMPAMRLSASMAAPTSDPRPITRLKTPFGRPARLMISDSAQALPGTRSAGLKTTQLP